MKQLICLYVALLCLLGPALTSTPAAAQSPPAAQVPSDPHAHLQQVMQDPLFSRWQRRQERAATPQSQTDWIIRVEQWADSWADAIENQLNTLLRWLFRSRNPSPAPTTSNTGFEFADFLKIAGWVLLGAVALMLIFIAIKMLCESRTPVERPRLNRKQIRKALEEGEALATDSEQWLDEARNLAQEQDLRLAYRAVYLALLSGLHRSRKIDFRTSRTNWTYVQHYRGDDAQRETFANLTSVFDDTWYGLHAPDQHAFPKLQQQVTSLLHKEPADA